MDSTLGQSAAKHMLDMQHVEPLESGTPHPVVAWLLSFASLYTTSLHVLHLSFSLFCHLIVNVSKFLTVLSETGCVFPTDERRDLRSLTFANRSNIAFFP